MLKLIKIFCLITILVTATSGCTTKERNVYNETDYKNSLISLALGFSAKEYCSCKWVMKKEAVYCKSFIKLDQLSPSISVDEEKKSVTASAFLLFRKKAHFISERLGCVLVP